VNFYRAGGESRRKLLGMAAAERALLLSPHLPFPGVGFSIPDSKGGFLFEPLVPPKL
jgi:hypothetical protein